MFISKNLILFTLSLFFFSTTFAQKNDSLTSNSSNSIINKKYYFQFGVGYNFSAGIGLFQNYTEKRDGSYSVENTNGSWGKGVAVSFGFGRKINKNLGVELDLGYFGAGRTKEKNHFYESAPAPAVPFTVDQNNYYSANTFSVNPKLVFEVPFKNENAFYSKIGYLIGVGSGKIVSEEIFVSDDGARGSANFEWKLSGGVVSGSTMALGIRFKAEKNLSFFIECTGNSLHRTFKEKNMTEAIENGRSTLDQREVYTTQTIYTNVANFTPLFNPKQPSVYPSYRSSYSSVGFKVGFIIHF